MTEGEFFCGLLGNDKALLAELDEVRKRHGLTKLYLAYLKDGEEVIWGARTDEGSVDYDFIASDLVAFMKKHTGVAYEKPEHSIALSILFDPLHEIEMLLKKEAIPYIESHGGKMKVEGVNEEEGVVRISLRGTCGSCPARVLTAEGGVERTLKSLLPWVKSVELVDPSRCEGSCD